MQMIAGREDMQAIDAYTIQEIGIPSAVLMERAAEAVVRRLLAYAAERTQKTRLRVLIVTEGGNNGGDGLAAARILSESGCQPEVWQIGGLRQESELYRLQKQILEKLDIPVRQGVSEADRLRWRQVGYDAVIDAVFGVGLHREIAEPQRTVLRCMNGLEGIKCAIDMPSGIDATTGRLYGTAFRADLTVTLDCRKTGQLIGDGPDYCGDIYAEAIGFPQQALEARRPVCFAYDETDVRRLLPERRPDGHKGTFGKVLIIAGSETMCGAALLSAEAAYRSGCGLVKILTHERNRTAVQTRLPEALLATYTCAEEAEALVQEASDWADAAVVGPGIGTQETGMALTRAALTLPCPLVADADAITNLSRTADWRSLRTSDSGLILTPHMKEMERISGIPLARLKETPWICAHTLSDTQRVVCVLKDARTVVTEPDAGDCCLNLTGNDGMATGGSGDVLTGVIAALAAQAIDPASAARLGVWLHGRAGDEAAARRGHAGMLAGDILNGLGSIE